MAFACDLLGTGKALVVVATVGVAEAAARWNDGVAVVADAAWGEVGCRCPGGGDGEVDRHLLDFLGAVGVVHQRTA